MLEQEQWKWRPFPSHSHHCCLGTLSKIKIRSCHTTNGNPGWLLFVCVTTRKLLGKTLCHYLAPALNPSPGLTLCFGRNERLASPWQLTPLLLIAPLTRLSSLLLTRLTPVISSRKPSSFSQQVTCSSTARNNPELTLLTSSAGVYHSWSPLDWEQTKELYPHPLPPQSVSFL